MKNKKRNSKGLSLIEASMVLALSAIVISGVMVYYQSASFNNKIKDTMIIVQAANNTIQSVFTGSSNNYEALIKDGNFILMNSANIPGKYKDKVNNRITTPFGGFLELEYYPLGSTPVAGDKYGLAIHNVPQGTCDQLAMMNLGSNHKETRIGVNFPKKIEELTPDIVTSTCLREKRKGISVSYFFK